MRRRALELARALCLAAVATLGTACGGAPAPQEGDDGDRSPTFAYVSPEPMGVNPFLLMGEQGLRAAAARHGARALVLESEDPTTREENLRAALEEGAELVVLLGFEFNDAVARLAPRAPETRFLIVDQCLDRPPPNVYCAVFREFEASFLIGAEAALLSRSGHVAAVGVVDIPFLHRYTEGFAAGARHVDPDIEVSIRWVGGESPFADPVRAKEQALALAAAGADQIFAAAAAGNLGIFEAAREKGFLAYGLDVDQCPAAPGRIVDSLIKRVDRVILEAIDAILGGGPRLLVFGLATGGLDLVALEDEVDPETPCVVLEHPEVVARIRSLARQVIEGEIGISDPMGLL